MSNNVLNKKINSGERELEKNLNEMNLGSSKQAKRRLRLMMARALVNVPSTADEEKLGIQGT